MNEKKSARIAWEKLRTKAENGTVSVPKSHMPHPRDAGARFTTTWPVGQIADYALDASVPGSAPLAIREFSDQWQAFVMGARLAGDVFTLIEKNPRAAYYSSAALVGGVVGTSLGKSKETMLLGAGLGLLLAAILDSD